MAGSEMPVKVLIVAAYASVRAGLHVLLGDPEDLEVIGSAGGSAGLERLLLDLKPDVVLADDDAGDRGALLALLAGGETGLVLLGESQEDWAALADAPLPGWAYLLRDADGAEIAGAVRATATGLIVLDRSLALMLRASARRGTACSDPARPGTLASDSALPSRGETLTVREREVLELMAQGLPNKLIAARLAISAHTAKFHVASILAKLGASSRTEAVTRGMRRGDVSL